DRVEQAFATGACREPRRCADFAKYADGGSPLIDQRDHRLRLESAALECSHDSRLHLYDRTRLCLDRAGVGNRDVTLGVNLLVRERDIVARTETGIGWCSKQTTRTRLEYRHAD